MRGMFLAFTAIALTLLANPSEATVCRLNCLDGLEAACARAKAILPKATRNVRELAIYVERDPDGGFFYASNFLSPDAENPTKIGREPQLLALEEAAMNIVFTEYPTDAQLTNLNTIYSTKAKVFVDRSVFNSDGSTELDFGNRTEIVLVEKAAPGSSTDGLILRRRPPIIAEKILGCCLHGRPPGVAASKLVDSLKNLKIGRQNMKLLSLVNDSATARAIDESGLSAKRVGPDAIKISNVTDFEPIFKQQRGKELILLGHVEGNDFVIRDARGEVVSNLPIRDIRALASKYDVLLFEVGCNTASRVDGAGGPQIGVATKFNTVDAVRRIQAALEQSRNMAEFLELLASENLQVVVDARPIENRVLYRAEYLDSSRGTAAESTVAQIQILSRPTGIFGRWTPEWLKWPGSN